MEVATDRGMASAALFDAVARRLLAQHAHELPDLRRAIVLLPNRHTAQSLAQALARKADVPALLLPRMLTLDEWAREIDLDVPLAADSRRAALLYQHLRRQRWFEQADLWGMTGELLKLFDELTAALGELPADAEAFAAAVEQAYEARRNEALQLEARLVFELWHAMQDGTELDATRAFQQRLAQLAQQAERPLYVLRASNPDKLEQDFLDTYARRAQVELFDLRAMRSPPPPAETAAVRKATLRFFAASSLEQEARAAAMQVRLWLAAGRRNIAVVAQDRVAARRMRALLERAEVLVADETGWTLDTLSVSTALDRWLAALQRDFYHHDLLDLLKSPFIFADMPADERKAAVFRLEQLLRKHGVVSGLQAFVTLAAGETVLQRPLERLGQAAKLLEHGRKRTLAEWLDGLRQSLHELGMDRGLRQDDAGRQLLDALDGWRAELAGDAGRFGFGEWRRWLAGQLDDATYRDSGIDSPVRFTHLAATRWRSFDAVLLLGCDADRLPGVADSGSFFNDTVRSALGLPTRALHAGRQRDDLHGLLALNDCVLATWQQEKDGEQRLLSPFLQILRDACDCPDAIELHTFLVLEDARTVELPQAAPPLPAATAGLLPTAISIGAYNSLVACPYQFYARHVLRLNELDEVQEAIEKRDYGERVHAILQRFHERYERVSEHPPAEMQAALHTISEAVFADLLAQDFAARAWLARWQKSLPAYLAWQTENEAQGWRHGASETAFSLDLEGVRLNGRIDRLDANGPNKRVLDYKTQGDQVLRNKLKEPGEDVQLACYAGAEQAGAAAYVSIEGGKVKTVAPEHDVGELARLNVERLQDLIARIRTGAALPANGIDAACAYCEMRGLCRKGEWSSGVGDQDSGFGIRDSGFGRQDSSVPLPLVAEGPGRG